MKHTILLLTCIHLFLFSFAQLEMDLSTNEKITETIDLNTANSIIFKNLLPGARDKNQYTIIIEMKVDPVPSFDRLALSGSPCGSQSKNLQEAILAVKNSESEKDLKIKLENLEREKKKITNQGCIDYCNALIEKTIYPKAFLFKLQNNQTIIITVKRQVNKDSVIVWTKTFKTPEKTRWLVHYGLTYAPSIISKVDHFHAFADTAVASRYTITKDNDNGPKPWDNISATINFTYPFHTDSRGFDAGFTAGFGISSGIELSGHAGLSLIIGENVIVGTGIAMMQKYKLLGKYKEGQIIKENLSFTDIHEKVWLPEIFFTLGFRFGSNPFAKKAADTPASSTPAETADTNQ